LSFIINGISFSTAHDPLFEQAMRIRGTVDLPNESFFKNEGLDALDAATWKIIGGKLRQAASLSFYSDGWTAKKLLHKYILFGFTVILVENQKLTPYSFDIDAIHTPGSSDAVKQVQLFEYAIDDFVRFSAALAVIISSLV
jgi:hypothetical protein